MDEVFSVVYNAPEWTASVQYGRDGEGRFTMIPLDLALIFFLLLAAFNYRLQRSVLYPPFIFSAMWLLDLATSRSGLIEVDPVHGNTLAIVAAGAASFSFGGVFAGLAPRKLLRFHLFPPKSERTPNFLRNVLTFVLLCGLPDLFYQLLQISKMGGAGLTILAEARTEIVAAAQSGEPIRSFVLDYFTQIAIFVSLLFATGKKDRQFWIVTVVAFFACVLSTGRGYFLLLISGLSAIRLIQAKQESLRNAIPLLRWPIALFAALFIGFIFINKDTGEMTGSTTSIATYSVLSYIVGSFSRLRRSGTESRRFHDGSEPYVSVPPAFGRHAASHLGLHQAPDARQIRARPISDKRIYRIQVLLSGVGHLRNAGTPVLYRHGSIRCSI